MTEVLMFQDDDEMDEPVRLSDEVVLSVRKLYTVNETVTVEKLCSHNRCFDVKSIFCLPLLIQSDGCSKNLSETSQSAHKIHALT